MEEPEDVVPQESCPVNRKDEGAIYSPARLSDEVIRMETGLPDKAMFSRVVGLVQRLEGSIVYAAGALQALHQPHHPTEHGLIG